MDGGEEAVGDLDGEGGVGEEGFCEFNLVILGRAVGTMISLAKLLGSRGASRG